MTQPHSDWRKKTALFLLGQTLSLFGSSVVSFAVIWYLTLETSSGVLMTVSILCTFLPQLAVTPIAGVWADRYSRKRLLILSDLFIAAATLLLALCFFAGYQPLWLLFAVTAVRSLGTGVQMPAVGAVLPQLVPPEQLVRVNAINTAAASAMMLVSPAVGGIVLAGSGFAWALMIDVTTALCAVALMLLIKIPPHHSESRGGAVAEMRAGFAYARGHRLIRRLLIFYAAFFVLISPAAFLTPLMVERSFGPEVWRLTVNEIAWTAGSLLGGLLLSVWGGPRNKLTAMGVASLGFGVTFAMRGLARNFVFYLAVMAVSGVFMPMFMAADTALLQQTVEESMMGRVFSVVQLIASAAMPLGMLAFGPLADLVAIEWILLATGGALVLLALSILTDRPLLGMGKNKTP